MRIERCSKTDFDRIVQHLDSFWEHDRTASLHHPILLYEFGDTAFVIREGGQPIAYLFGLFSQVEPTAYVQLIAVHRSARGRGLATALYKHFISVARKHGCREIKAITHPSNRGSIAFHERLGMHLEGTPNRVGIPVVRDYSGPGKDRVVFRMALTGPAPSLVEGKAGG